MRQNVQPACSLDVPLGQQSLKHYIFKNWLVCPVILIYTNEKLACKTLEKPKKYGFKPALY